MAAVLGAGRRACDLVVVDLPRHLDEAAEVVATTAQTVLVVVPAEVRATASAARVVTRLAPLAPDVRLVVRGPAPAGLSAQTVAESLGLPLAGSLRPEPGLAGALERGEPPTRSGRGPLAKLCRSLLDDLAPARSSVA
jgi:secretion/DNA translocation related CpaE-like protein